LPQHQEPTSANDSEYRGRVSVACRLDGWPKTAPVSLQKQPCQCATNAVKLERKRSRINENHHYPAAHNGLVAGSSPAGPTNDFRGLQGTCPLRFFLNQRNNQRYLFRRWPGRNSIGSATQMGRMVMTVGVPKRLLTDA
jgi:hypothetical protein